MKKFYSSLSIGLVCLILGIIISIQFKTVNDTIGTGFLPNQKSKELAIELRKYQEDKDKLINELHNLEKNIKEFQDDATEDNTYLDGLSKELERYQIFAGLEDVKGPGLIITIEDEINENIFNENDIIIEETSSIIDYYDYILTIISNLNIAKAEAISINGLRYTSFSELLRVGSHLNFNGIAIGSPIEIKVIGPKENLEAALIYTDGVIDIMKNILHFKINIETDDNIIITRYNRVIDLEYAKPVDN